MIFCYIGGMSCAREEATGITALKGPYIGQKPPGMTPELFADELLSVEGHSAIGVSPTPDGNEIYFTSWNRGSGAAIMVAKREGRFWLEPQIVSFSGVYRDWDLGLSPDGQTMYFSSLRPVPGSTEPKTDSDIWYVRRESDGDWGTPIYIESINTDMHEVHPSVSSNGTLYLFSHDTEGKQMPDLYMSTFKNGKYEEPIPLGKEINTEHAEADPFIAPDESYLIFHSNRPGGYGFNDLYISFMTKEGKWSEAINMGKLINTEHRDFCGRVMFDGKFLIFSRRSEDDSYSHFYWMDAKILENLNVERMRI